MDCLGSNQFTVNALETWTLLTLPSSKFRNCEKSFFAVIGRTDKLCFKFRSPRIPLSSLVCSGFKGLSEQSSVFLTSRSFARTGQLLISRHSILLGNKVSNHDG